MSLKLSGVRHPPSAEEDAARLLAAVREHGPPARRRVIEAVEALHAGKGPWKLAKTSKCGVKVHTADKLWPGDAHAEFRVVASSVVLPAPPLFVFSLVHGVSERRRRWDDKLDEHSRVARHLDDENDVVFMSSQGIAGIVSARQSVQGRHFAPTPDGGLAQGAFTVVDDEAFPADPSVVRCNHGTCGAVLEPVTDGGPEVDAELFAEFHEEMMRMVPDAPRPASVPATRLTFVFQPNPAGRVPMFMLRKMMPKLMLESVVGLRKAVDRVVAERKHLEEIAA